MKGETMDTTNPMPEASTASASTEKVGIFSIVVGVFTSPTKAFENFKNNPNVWVPIVLMAILAAAVGVGMAKYNAVEQYEMMKSSTTLPPQALDSMRQSVEKPSLVGPLLGGLLVAPIIVLISAAIARFLGGFVFGGNTRYWHVVGVAALGGLIPTLGNIIRLPLVMSKGSVHVSFGLAALMSGKDFTSILYALAYFFDAFAIWGIIVTGIGYAILFGIKRGQGISTAVIASVIMTGLYIGLMVIGFAFAGVDVTFM